MRCLSVAGFDPSGSAGLLVDRFAIESTGATPLLVVAALTAQSLSGARAVLPVSPDFVLRQLVALLEDGKISAAKTGVLFSADNIRAVASFFREHPMPLVIDPVINASSGIPLLEPGALGVLRKELFPLARLVTPNLDEAETLTGIKPSDPEDMAMVGELISSMGPTAVLIKGGHLDKPIDLLWSDGVARIFPHARKPNKRGTGCALSAAIAGRLAVGADLPEAVAWGIDWIQSIYLERRGSPDQV
ncbi:MAG: hydroxymethylpyrimidine/phosphomethylpyrimidine kinase [candidate division WOR-3 bacterium]